MHNERLRRYGVAGLQILAVAAAYYGAGKLGLLLDVVKGQITPLWPPTGIALAALLVLGLRTWPGITLGAYLIEISIEPIASSPAVLVITAGNTLAPLCAYLLLRRVGFRDELDRFQDALALVFLGALVGMLVSATLGTGALELAGGLPSGGFWQSWSAYWAGDAMGVLVVAPVLLVLRRAHWPRGVPLSRWAEAAALLAGTLLVADVATGAATRLFLFFPLLIWAAFRFQRAGAAPCALIMSALVTLASARNSGPFAGHDLFTNMVTLQAFNVCASLTALLLAAVISERNRTHEEIKRVCAQLSEVVATLEPREPTPRWPPPQEDCEQADEDRAV
ncbi:hypothetical protein C7M71_018710 [Peterkaempfera bronchialis]|uniref:MASE1 domain-containing protein n=1 Tax=Peterkaempfera bronchialis TaxID=2126346 RepID=A0A345T6A0_9ACTN|nr:hypothetical protein C7M71_018710 [Peterkaempfera bronchialis]